MQDAVFPLHINAARRDIHDVAVTVGDGGDQRAGRRIILPIGGIGIRDDVTRDSVVPPMMVPALAFTTETSRLVYAPVASRLVL